MKLNSENLNFLHKYVRRCIDPISDMYTSHPDLKSDDEKVRMVYTVVESVIGQASNQTKFSELKDCQKVLPHSGDAHIKNSTRYIAAAGAFNLWSLCSGNIDYLKTLPFYKEVLIQDISDEAKKYAEKYLKERHSDQKLAPDAGGAAK